MVVHIQDTGHLSRGLDRVLATRWGASSAGTVVVAFRAPSLKMQEWPDNSTLTKHAEYIIIQLALATTFLIPQEHVEDHMAHLFPQFPHRLASIIPFYLRLTN